LKDKRGAWKREVHEQLDERLGAFCRLAEQGGGDPAERRRQATEIMTAFALGGESMADFNPTYARDLLEKNVASHQLTLLALALEIGRAEQGRYPTRLESLVGRYVESLPLDPFSGKGLVYRRQGEGNVVYSIGPNLRDDGGRTSDDGEDCDDIVVRAVVPTRTE